MEAGRWRERTVASVVWSAAGRAGQQGVQFAISIVLARLLLPEHFGLLGMLAVFIGFAMLFAELGLGAALIQSRDLDDAQVSSTFWLNLAVGVSLTILFMVLAPAIAAFYGIPELVPLGRVIALTFVFGALGVVPAALLKRRMAFRRLAVVETTVAVLAGVTAIILAFSGLGVWSLVVHSLVVAFATSALTWWLAAWRPKLVLSASGMGSMLRFSTNLFGFNFVNYWARNADNLLVGKFLSSAALGIYARAYSLMLLPLRQVTRVVGQVMFPALSAIQEDRARVRRIWVRAYAVIGLIAFPIMTGLLVVAGPFVAALLGEKWLPVVPVLQILCVVGVIQTLVNPVGWIYQSQGRTDLQFRWGLAASTGFVGAIAAGVWLGTVEAVAWSYLVANLVLVIPSVWIPARIVDLPLTEVFRAVAGALACSIGMSLLVFVVDRTVIDHLGPGWRLAVDVTLGVLVYGALVRLVKPRGAVDAWRLLTRRPGRRSVSAAGTGRVRGEIMP